MGAFWALDNLQYTITAPTQPEIKQNHANNSNRDKWQMPDGFDYSNTTENTASKKFPLVVMAWAFGPCRLPDMLGEGGSMTFPVCCASSKIRHPCMARSKSTSDVPSHRDPLQDQFPKPPNR
eukprot:3504594-Amphidinium_carterae.1